MDSAYSHLMRDARQTMDKELLKSLRDPNQAWVVLATALVWAQLILSWWMALFLAPWFAVISFIINCAMLQAMLTWTHEASHFMLFRNRRLNDFWADLFFAAPAGISVAAYRHKHLTHHAHLGVDKDEDSYAYRFNVKGGSALARFLLITLSGWVGLKIALEKYLTGAARGASGKVKAPLVHPLVSLGMTAAFNVGLLAACIAVGRWWLYPLLWLYPIIAVSMALNGIRTIAEHQPDDFTVTPDGKEVGLQAVVRTTRPNPFEKWLMYQTNFNYHVEHHLYPQIPFHNLAPLHRHLAKNGFYQRHPDCLQRSGIGRFVRIAMKGGMPSEGERAYV